MLTLQIKDETLTQQITDLLQRDFEGSAEKMLQGLIQSYTAQLNRLKYSNILKWQQDGIAYQKEIRNEWG